MKIQYIFLSNSIYFCIKFVDIFFVFGHIEFYYMFSTLWMLWYVILYFFVILLFIVAQLTIYIHHVHVYIVNIYICIQFDHAKEFFFLLTIYINNVVQYTMYVINKINSCAKSGWYARHQHSYNICKDFLSHNSWMKNLNFTNSWEISKDYQFQ
jgi:hypothetical protein